MCGSKEKSKTRKLGKNLTTQQAYGIELGLNGATTPSLVKGSSVKKKSPYSCGTDHRKRRAKKVGLNLTGELNNLGSKGKDTVKYFLRRKIKIHQPQEREMLIKMGLFDDFQKRYSIKRESYEETGEKLKGVMRMKL